MNMIRFLMTLCILIMLGSTVVGQSFTKVTTGPVVTEGKGSRSVNFVDINGDGLDDLFVSNGKSGGENNLLYLNDGAGGFTQVLTGDIVTDGLSSDGASFADFNNDYTLDAFVGNWYGQNNRLYKNIGSLFYLESTQLPSNDGGHSESCSWADIDNDGDLDLFVANSDGDLKNYLYLNDGTGNFTKNNSSVVGTDTDISRCGVWADYDNDNDLDLYVANEGVSVNRLYENNGDGTFTKITSGDLVTDIGNSWGASWGDYDNDGDFDLFVANNGGEWNYLYQNNGDKTFTRITTDPIVLDGSYSVGSSWIDYDNDGYLDMFVVNGWGGVGQNNLLYHNNGNGTFTKIADSPLTTDLGWSYGSGWADYDSDGDLDVMIARWQNETESNTLYTNEIGTGNNYYGCRLVGTVSNSNGVGALIRVSASIGGVPVTQIKEVSSQHGYCSQNSYVQHFGLGDALTIDSIVINWPSGAVSSITNIPVNQVQNLYEPGVRILADTTYGYQSLDVQFEGITGESVTQWNWSFGDGTISNDPAPLKTYAEPGLYTVGLEIITTTGTYITNRDAYIGVQADTIEINDDYVVSGTTIDIPVYLSNDLPLQQIEIPIHWSGPLNLTFIGIIKTGYRGEVLFDTLKHFDGFNKRMWLRLSAAVGIPLTPGDGPLLHLQFSVPASPPGDSTVIKIEPYDDKLLRFVSSFATYEPEAIDGVLFKQCCFGMRGNIDNDPTDQLSITDLLYFVDYFFDAPPGPAPACDLEADVNGSGLVDISDLLYLVDYFFAFPSGPAPTNCPG